MPDPDPVTSPTQPRTGDTQGRESCRELFGVNVKVCKPTFYSNKKKACRECNAGNPDYQPRKRPPGRGDDTIETYDLIGPVVHYSCVAGRRNAQVSILCGGCCEENAGNPKLVMRCKCAPNKDVFEDLYDDY